MKTTQAWTWLTTGVLALGLNGFYRDGGASLVHRAVVRAIDQIEERSGPVVALAAGRADWFVARTKMAGARDQIASCRRATAMARAQTSLLQNKSAQTQNRWVRVEAPVVKVRAPVEQVEVMGTGPI